jgi:GNAT superfamily N-acetyltransferase
VREVTSRSARRAPCQAEPGAWRVRAGGQEDVPALADAARRLLIELGATPPAPEAMRETARTMLADADAGALLLAESGRETIGFLGASFQSALRVPGAYALIQELWVHPRWRSREVGGELLAALFSAALARGVTRVEVGLPGESFPALCATEAFYAGNGFRRTGTRMRRLLG